MWTVINLKKEKAYKFRRTFREYVAFVIWIFAILQLFFIDFYTYFHRLVPPEYNQIFDITFLTFIFITISVFTIKDKRNIYKTILYTLFYPFLLILPTILKIVLKPLFIFGIFLTYFNSSWKEKIISMCSTILLIVFYSLIFSSNSKIIITISIVGVIVYIANHFIMIFYKTFKINPPLKASTYVLIKIWNKIKYQFLLKENLIPLKDVPKNPSNNDSTPQKEETRIMSISILVGINQFFLFLKSKLTLIKERRIILLYPVLSLLLTILITVFSFAFIVLGLHKLNSSAYYLSTTPMVSDFLYYSTNTLFHINTPQFYPISFTAKLFFVIESFLGVLILIFLVSFIVIVQRGRYDELIEGILIISDRFSNEAEIQLFEDYKVNMKEAFAIIDKSSIKEFQNIIYHFSSNAQFKTSIETYDLLISGEEILKNGNIKQAELKISEAYVKDKYSPYTLYCMGLIAGEKSNYIDMMKFFNKAISIDDSMAKKIDSVKYKHFNLLYNNGVSHYNKYLGFLNDKTKNSESSLTSCIEYFIKALIIKNDYMANRLIAISYKLLSDIKKQLVDLNAALETPNKEILAYIDLGYYYQEQEEYLKASEFFKNGVEFEAKNEECLIRYAECLDLADRKEEAIVAYKAAIKKSPKERAASFNLGLLLFKKANECEDNEVERNRYMNEAIRYFIKTYRIDPNIKEVYDLLGTLLLQLEKYGKAKKYLEIGSKYFPHSSSIWQNLSYCYNKLGKENDAEEAYKKSESLKGETD